MTQAAQFEYWLEQYLAGELTGEELGVFELEILKRPELSRQVYADASMRTAIAVAAAQRRADLVPEPETPAEQPAPPAPPQPAPPAPPQPAPPAPPQPAPPTPPQPAPPTPPQPAPPPTPQPAPPKAPQPAPPTPPQPAPPKAPQPAPPAPPQPAPPTPPQPAPPPPPQPAPPAPQPAPPAPQPAPPKAPQPAPPPKLRRKKKGKGLGWRKASLREDPTAIPPERALQVLEPHRPWYQRAWFKFGVPAIAVVSAVVSLVVLRPGLTGLPGIGSRSGGTPGFAVVEPDSMLSKLPGRFVWTRAAEAEQYRFELFDAMARPVTMVLTADTVLVMDPEVDVVPPEGHWSVTPMTQGLTPLGEPITSRYRVTK